MTTNYYDENGSEIQTLSTNIKGGTDVSTNQYGWDGRLLANASKHSVPGSDYNNYYILTKLNYDQIGRVASQEKKFGTNAWKVISQLNYDDLGRVGGKRLDPSYAEHFSGIGPIGGGLEYLKYSYNVQGRLVGINKDYAQKVDYNKWGNFFGIYLSYADPVSSTFTNAARLNGQLRGVIWNSQGDAEQRKYQYTYDNAGRLTKAEFANRNNPWESWSSTQLDFSEGYGTNTITYDLNGNITVLARKGVQFGNNTAVVVDDLRYTYENFSNKLKSVADITSVASTATVGDFKDGNTANNDYVYDDNGNLVVDLNKNIKNLAGANGVTYNHLDKPVEIKIEGKGTVKITYDADGAKLKREFLNSVTNATKITWYLGEYQYEEVVGGASPKAFAVEFISFGEGRIRPITPRNESNTYDALQLDGNLTLPNGKKGSIDYFISDHRTDVRMILTEEKQWSYTTASMETASSRNTVEEGLFSTQVNLSRAPKTEVPGWTANTSQYVSKLNNTRPVGPNQLLKVMAGDLLHANVQYYYQQVATNSSGSTVFSSVLSMLGSSITGSAVTSAATKAASTSIIANLNTGLPFSQVISPDITSSTGNLPKAYLNVVFFDERFNFVSESSTSVRVGAANVAANLALTQIKAPENGYCYVYISNESTVSVYFDNLQVRHDRGRIVEENHYYAYGLRINAISSKAYGGPANNYLYQGDFAELDEDLGWTDFMLRSYDAEIGRFLQNDPYDEFRSGYVGMGNDPANLLDPTGGSTLPEFVFTVTVKTGSNLKPFMKVFQLATTVTTISVNFTNLGSSTRDLPNVIGMSAHKALSDYLRLQNSLFGEHWIVDGILDSGLKPDVVNSFTKTVWELKPISNWEGNSKSRFGRAITQISRYVRQINLFGIKNHRYVNGVFRAGGTYSQAPVYNGMPLMSSDKAYKFIFSVPDPSNGIIYYEHIRMDPPPDGVPAYSYEKAAQKQSKTPSRIPAETRKTEKVGRSRIPNVLGFFLRVRLPLIIDGLGELLVPPSHQTKQWEQMQ